MIELKKKGKKRQSAENLKRKIHVYMMKYPNLVYDFFLQAEIDYYSKNKDAYKQLIYRY